jgi:16S rRNA (guanine527-N7)-methyltransferase
MKSTGADAIQEIDFIKWREVLCKGTLAFQLHLTDNQIQRFYMHARALLQWSKRVNLTAIRDPYEIAVKHFVDSLVPVVFFTPRSRVLDMGSGGGFPGLPLKVLHPAIDLTMVDAVRKKTSFIQHVARQLKLDHTRALHMRVENLARQPSVAEFDTIVCRAFSSLSFSVEHALPILSAGGQIVLWKGHLPEADMGALQNLLSASHRFFSVSTHVYKLPIIGAHRTIVIIKEQLT